MKAISIASIAVIAGCISLVGCRLSQSNTKRPPQDEITNTGNGGDDQGSSKPVAPGTKPVEPGQTGGPVSKGKAFEFTYAGGPITASISDKGDIELLSFPKSFVLSIQLIQTTTTTAFLESPTGYCEGLNTILQKAADGDQNSSNFIRTTRSFDVSTDYFPILTSGFKEALIKEAKLAAPTSTLFNWINRPEPSSFHFTVQTTPESYYAMLGRDDRLTANMERALSSQASVLSGRLVTVIQATDLMCDLSANRASLEISFKIGADTVTSRLSGF